MTDSMKFGPEWLRNMSAEPSVIVSSNNMNVAAIGTGGGLNNTLSLHNLSGGNILTTHTNTQSHTAASRNLFPEYRYGREEMLSLFERNCLLPQILPSFRKLFVEKVQYPLALTPSSEEDMNSQSTIGNSSRPSWLQRSAGGFGLTSRGSSRGGTVDRGRMRGKSVYHPIYQRSSAIYDESVSATSMKPERNWNERNGTGDSAAVGSPSVSNSSCGTGLDWNVTPGSSPRKEFSTHNRNMENWRRNRNEDGSGDGPIPGGVSAGIEVAGWRSGGTHRWGRSTSWRDEEPIQGGNVDSTGFVGNTTAHIQRSISTIGTVGTDRNSASVSAKASSATLVSNANRQATLKWSGSSCNNNVSGADGDDNLPEWAMENPSEMGGTFDSSGAFHGESADSPTNITTPRKKSEGGLNISESKHIDCLSTKENLVILTTTNDSNQAQNHQNEHAANNEALRASDKLHSKSLDREETFHITTTDGSDIPTETATTPNINNTNSTQEVKLRCSVTPESTPTHKSSVVHGDISERFKEVADEVEKLIMDDECGVEGSENHLDGISTEVPVSTTTSINVSSTTRYVIPGLSNSSLVDAGQLQHQHQLDTTTNAMLSELAHKPLPFTNQLTMQHHQHQQHQNLSVVPPHMINANPNDLWFYRDPQSNVQGPFSSIEMTEWYRAGYFNENLFVRRFSDSRFRPLGELIKLCHGNMPFTHSHLLPTPMVLDNLQITLTPRKSSNFNLPISLGEQHVDEQLKANVTAAADSLCAAVRGHMISTHTMDTSHMLTMRFQMLQDQYLQHQEYQILSELSKNECFQRLDAAQREAIVRSKVQMLVLPEYLSSFNGLSNSLAALNPIAGSQLYDVISQQAKKDQQQRTIFPNPCVDQRPTGNFLDANDFIINAQLKHQQTEGQTQQVLQSSPSDHPVQQFGSDPTETENKVSELSSTSTNLDLLNEYNLRMLLRGPSAGISQQQQATLAKPNSNDYIAESQLLSAQNLIMPIWPQQAQAWPGMANAKVTLWDVTTLEEEQSQQLLLQQQHKHHLSAQDNSSRSDLDFVSSPQQDQNKPDEVSSNILQAQQAPNLQGQPNADILTQSNDQQTAQNQAQGNVNSKHSIKQQQPLQQHQFYKHLGKHVDLKITEEERRREQLEEKRRIKEERKRQQQEEEKRRTLHAEEEKNRQLQEEKERQHQIQAQRRKALLGSNPQSSSGISGSTPGSGVCNKSSVVKIEQLTTRGHGTSIAPWSLKSSCVNNIAPGLAEIQKAERRERRADQQRQQEQLDKQIRATAAAAAEANDALLKWQASPAPAPVMSLIDIQAEEAKRLANELLEHQRRRDRDHEQNQQQGSLTASLTVSSGLSNIWGNAKAWGPGSIVNTAATATSSALWDDLTPPPALPSKHIPLGGNATAASVLASGLILTNKQQLHTKSASILPSPRNLRKTQTLPAMQNVLSKNIKTVCQQPQLQQHQDKNKIVQSKSIHKVFAGNEDKKHSVKSQQQSGDTSAVNSKISEYENEFTIWCMKSLENMSAKVDVPTFVAFLQDLEAPYEVKDYVRIYLGEGKESTDFAKQFLERRSKYKSLQRAQNAHNDDMCKPAPAITPSSNDNGDNKNKQKKIKKNKMTKMDARILGFSVTAAEGRINVGGRDYVDAP